MAPEQDSTSKKRPHVCVVGAGISGLRCADMLLAEGFEVTILEARNRIGGRICQSEELGYPIDLGPNWIHDWAQVGHAEPHPILQLAIETSTPMHHWNDKQLLFDSAGHSVPQETADRLSALLWDILESGFRFSQEAYDRGTATSIPAGDSLYEYVERRARQLVPNENEQQLLAQMSEMFGGYVGMSIRKQSLRFAWLEQCCNGEAAFVESDFSGIVQRVARPAIDRASVLLNTAVTSILTPQSRELERQVQVTVTSGATFLFDEVVMSVPLGWLKRNLAAFTPPLPERLARAVQSLGLAHLEKIFVTFPTAFWRAGSAEDEFPCYTNWLAPGYAPAQNPERWPMEAWDVSAFRPPNDRPALLFYMYGDCSKHVVNLVHGKAPEEKTRLLVEFLRPYFSLLPGYDATDARCAPTAAVVTEWLQDEWSGYASYCNFQVGIDQAVQDVLAIRQGSPDRRLWFCGEHTAQFEECGTVAGAYLSGQAVGERIVKLYSAACEAA
ncbi:FAD/NAD(P)-binding domain-containing protein [Thozetella sp. PMI_491]|nr:FAD/NAD(P)-binding domain-containing protein [Thozetella sp. PMI_491]